MFEILLEGDKELERMLGTVTGLVSDLSTPIQCSLEYMSKSVLETFAVGGRPPWDDITQASRDGRQFDHGTPPLWDGGALADAATATRPGVEGSAYVDPRTRDGLEGAIGPEADFHGARRHQEGFGTDRLGRTFDEPVRAFMVWQAGDRIAVVEIFDLWLAAVIEEGIDACRF